MKTRIALAILIVLLFILVISIPSPTKSLIPSKVLTEIEPDSDIVLVLETSKFSYSVENDNFIVKNNQGSVGFKPFKVGENSQLDVILENWTSTQENVYIYPEGCNYLQIRIHELVSKESSFKCLSEI
jgi:hypothetical protein